MKAFVSKLGANAMASALSVLLVLVMARATDSATIGKFLWIVALCSVLPIAFDTASLQYLSQKTRNQGIQGVDADLWISSFTLNRAFALFAISLAQTTIFFVFDFLSLQELLGLLFAIFASSLSSQLNNQLAQVQTRKLFIRLQLAVSSSTAILVTVCLFSTFLSLETLFVIFGLSRSPAALFILKSWKKTSRVESFSLLLSQGFQKFTILFATQFTNATSTFIDAALVASFGFARASAYQLVQRPLLLLSLVNVTIGQDATRSALRGDRIERRKVLQFAWVGAFAGGLFGYASHALLPIALGRALEISPAIAIALGAAYGLSSATSLSGPHVLLAMKNRTLLVSSVGQIFLIVISFLVLGASLGAGSLALGVLLAKLFALAAQIKAIET